MASYVFRSLDEPLRLLLHENDTITTHVKLDQRSVDPLRAGLALQASDHVSSLNVNLSSFLIGANIDGILIFLSTSTRLNHVVFRRGGVNAQRMTPFLRAVSSNPSIKKCEIYRCNVLVADMAAALPQLICLQFLRSNLLTGNNAFAHPDEQAVVDLLHTRGTSLRQLYLSTQEFTSHVGNQMLKAMQSHPTVEHVEVVSLGFWSLADDPVVVFAMSESIGNLVESSTRSLESIGMAGFAFTEATFAPLAAGLSKSSTATWLYFRECTFDAPSGLLVASIFGSESSTMHALSFQCTAQFANPIGAMRSFIGASSLQQLNLDYCTTLRNDLKLFRAIIDALKQANVTALKFGALSREQCEILLTGLPEFRKVAYLSYSVGADSAGLKDHMLAAYRSNSSVTAGSVEAPFLEQEGHDTLDWCARRNKMLPILFEDAFRLVENGDSLCFRALPEILEASLETGPTDTFVALRELAARICRQQS